MQCQRLSLLNPPLRDPQVCVFVERLARRLLDNFPVIGMDALEEGLAGARKLLRRDAEEIMHLVGPTDITGLEVPLPVAEVGDSLGVNEARLAMF